MKWYATGHDFGNNEVGSVTILSKSEQWMHTMPTAFCRVDVDVITNLNSQEVQLQAQKQEPTKKGRGKATKASAKANQKPKETDASGASVIQFMNESLAYAVGNYALSQGKRVWTGRGDDLRYATKHSARGLIANVATRIPDKEFGLYVVTGLPGDLYMKHGMSLRKQIKEALDGVYDFIIDGQDDPRRCTVEVATVVMEGAGALIAYSDRFPVSKTALCGVIDIGGGTTDLYAQRNGAPVTEYCQSDRNGVEAAALILRQIFEKKYPDRALSDGEVREVMFAFASENTGEYPFPTITYYGKAVPETELAAMAEEAVDLAADDITSFIASAWREAHGGAGFSPLVLIGGGYHYFFKKVKERIPHVVDLLDTGSEDDRNKENMLDPVYANAKGYAILASRFLKKKMEAEAAAAAAAKEQGQIVEGSVNQNTQESEEITSDADQKEVAAATAPESHDRYWNA